MARVSRNNGTRVVDLDEEESVGSQGTFGKVVPVAAQVRESRPRKAPEEHPTCPHCGAKMHWNQAAATINFECLWRQYSLATGAIDSPNDRLPVFGDNDIAPFSEWVATRKKSRKNPLAYGKMPAANGIAGTYASLRAAQKAESAEETAKAVTKNGTAKTAKPKKSELIADPLAAKRANRKAKVEEPVVEAPAKKRGRPPKHAILETPEIVIEAPAKKRGRPKKEAVVEAPVVEAPAKKRGRPPKTATQVDATSLSFDLDEEVTPTKPGKSGKKGAKAKGKSKKGK